MRNVTILLAVVAVLAAAGPAYAAARCWNSATEDAWTVAARWDGGVPAIGDDVYLVSGGTANINNGVTASVGLIVIGGHANAACTAAGGTAVSGDGHLKIHAGGSFTTGWAAIGSNRTGTITQDGGTSTFNGAWMYVGGPNRAANINMSGGTMNLNAGNTFLGQGGKCTFLHTGGTVKTSVSLHMPRHEGVEVGGLYEISNDAVLDVGGTFNNYTSGVIHVKGASATIDLDGYYQTGDLQFTTGSGVSTIAVSGAATFGGALKFTETGTYSGPYTLMTFGSSSGTFSSVDLPTGYTHQITSGALTVIPEPATLALLGIGGLGVLIRRRRK